MIIRRINNDGPSAATARSALTMPELVLVMMLIGLGSFIVVPLATDRQMLTLDRAAERIVSDLQYVQGQAMIKRRAQQLVFDLDNQFYWYPSDGNLDEAARDPITKRDYRVLFSTVDDDDDGAAGQNGPYIEAFPEITLASVDFDGEQVIYFDPLGWPIRANGATPARARIVITAGTNTRTITIDPASGRMTIN